MPAVDGSLAVTRSVIDFRPLFFVIGIMLIVLALTMMLPAIADVAAGNPDWQVFMTASLLTLFVGVSLVLMNRQAGRTDLTGRQAFLLTSLLWLTAAAF